MQKIKKILIMFNIEILEILINDCKINRDNLYFIADSKYDLQFVKCYRDIKIL
jgi:hypothetical protein